MFLWWKLWKWFLWTIIFIFSLSRAQSVWTCATNCSEVTSDIEVATKTQYTAITLEMDILGVFSWCSDVWRKRLEAHKINDWIFSVHRESHNKGLSSRYNMHDLLSAGFIPLTRDKKTKQDDTDSMELPKGFHSVYTSIEYECASPLYQHTGSSRRTCLKSGRWSGRHVSCSPGESNSQSVNNFNCPQLGNWICNSVNPSVYTHQS